MKKLTVAEAAEHFNVSKEAIHNRIRRGSLDCVIEHGVKYVVVGENGAKAMPASAKQSTTAQHESKYHDYIEKENVTLKGKVEKLEGEIERLRQQREQMLIDERVKIEQIYKERDEQLRSVLGIVTDKLLTHDQVEDALGEAVNAEIVEEAPSVSAAPKEDASHVSLKEFLKLKKYKEKQKEEIKKRFKKAAKDDDRIMLKEGKIYLNPTVFDYSDLLA